MKKDQIEMKFSTAFCVFHCFSLSLTSNILKSIEEGKEDKSRLKEVANKVTTIIGNTQSHRPGITEVVVVDFTVNTDVSKLMKSLNNYQSVVINTLSTRDTFSAKPPDYLIVIIDVYDKVCDRVNF